MRAQYTRSGRWSFHSTVHQIPVLLNCCCSVTGTYGTYTWKVEKECLQDWRQCQIKTGAQKRWPAGGTPQVSLQIHLSHWSQEQIRPGYGAIVAGPPELLLISHFNFLPSLMQVLRANLLHAAFSSEEMVEGGGSKRDNRDHERWAGAALSVPSYCH